MRERHLGWNIVEKSLVSSSMVTRRSFGRRIVVASAGLVLPLVDSFVVAAPPNPQPPPNAVPERELPNQLIQLARQSYQGVRDYSCLFVKREKINGQAQPENIIHTWVRTQPFSVHFRWHSPKPQAGQEVCFVAGRNEGMMRVLPCGVLRAVGWVSLDPKDARAMQNNRHPITECGIGNLIERLAKHWQTECATPNVQVRVAEYDYNKRRCSRVEVTHLERSGQHYAYRSVVYFDKENHLPIRIENYDWPRANAPQGELLESYSYVDLKLNVGIGDEAFNF